MNPVNLFATQPHYLDHLAPIWHALHPAERGQVWCGNVPTKLHARDLGLAPQPRSGRTYPIGRDTMIGKIQPHVLVAGESDYRNTMSARCVFVAHGAGQTYVDDPGRLGSKPEVPRSRVDLFLMPGPDVADQWRARNPRTPVEAIGCPKLDPWINTFATTNRLPRSMLRELNTDPTIAVTFHWEPPESRSCPERRSSYAHWAGALAELADQAEQRHWRLLGHAHPRDWPRMAALWARLDVEMAYHLTDVYDQADVLVADNTSAMFEMAALDRPIVVLNAPWYRPHVEHGLRFWTHAGLGPNCWDGQGNTLVTAVEQVLGHDQWQEARARATTQVYGGVTGAAAPRAAQAIRSHLP